MALELDEIAEKHFAGHKRLAPGGSAGKPHLATILRGQRAGLLELEGRIDDLDGTVAAVTTSALFTQPSSAANVAITVTKTSPFTVGAELFIENGGFYEVVSIASATGMTVKNLGYADNASPAATIASGSDIIIAGARGAAGTNGTNGTNGLPWTRGTTTLVSGTKNITSQTITANSRVRVNPITLTGTAFGHLEAPLASYTIGAGTGAFTINSKKADGSGVETGDGSLVLWEIVEIIP
jgi:hypothetical protein